MPQKIDPAAIHGMTQRELLMALVITMNSVCDACVGISQRIDTQNGRVNKLEAWRNYTLGIAAVVVMVVGIIIPWALGKL